MADTLDILKSYLSTNWNPANTDGITPEFAFTYDVKAMDTGNKDYVLLYSVSSLHPPNALGGQTKDKTDRITIMVNTTGTRAHGIKMKEEIERIFDYGYKNPANLPSGINEFEFLNCLDMSHGGKRYYKFIFDWNLKIYNVNR